MNPLCRTARRQNYRPPEHKAVENFRTRTIVRAIAAQPAPWLQVMGQRGVPGGARWTLERLYGGLGLVCSPACTWPALRDATHSPDRRHLNGQALTHRIPSPTTFRIEPYDGHGRAMPAPRSVSVAEPAANGSRPEPRSRTCERTDLVPRWMPTSPQVLCRPFLSYLPKIRCPFGLSVKAQRGPWFHPRRRPGVRLRRLRPQAQAFH